MLVIQEERIEVMINKAKYILLTIALSFGILMIPHTTAQARELSIKVNASEEATEYLKILDTAQYGTLCYDLYKVYSIYDIPKDIDVNLKKYTNEAMEKFVGNVGDTVNESDKADYSGLRLNEKVDIKNGVYLMVVRGTKPNTTVIKKTIMAGADGESYEESLVTFSLLDYHMYTVKPQFIIRSDDYTLKMLVDPAISSIKINKAIKKYYADVENTTFVFKVDVFFPDENTLYSSEVYSMNFTGVGNKSLVINGIPIGSTVKVSEVYKGLSYETYIGDEQTHETAVKVTGQEPVEIEFENKYSNKQNHGGGGVVNRFEFNLLDGKGEWKWEKNESNETTINGITDRFFEQLSKYNVFINTATQ